MKTLIAIFLGTTLFWGCKTDLDITAPYKETMVVYGLLNQADTVQYIKINKAFLGKGNALEMATVYDSTNYNPANLEVILNNTATGNVITLQPDASIPKNTGQFPSPNQTIYKTTHTVNANDTYNLQITNTKTGNKVIANTQVIGDYVVNNPSPFINAIAFISSNPANIINYKVEWKSAPNTRKYEVMLRFYYTEGVKSDPVNTATTKYIDWNIGSAISSFLTGGETMGITFEGESFYRYLATVMVEDANLYRKPAKIDFMFFSASDDFNTFLEVNKPSTSITQERAEYTNIENGTGIFASRYIKYVRNKTLNDASLKFLYNGTYTKKLNFCSPIPTNEFYCGF